MKTTLKTIFKFFINFLKTFPSVNDLSINFISTEFSNNQNSFIKDDGTIINLIPNYRWSLKKGWLDFRGLFLLNFLKNKSLLNDSEIAFLDNSVNEFTITKSEDEINKFVTPLIFNKYKDLFFIDENSNIFIKPNTEALLPKVRHYENVYQSFVSKSDALKKSFKPGNKILEVGFESGGFSMLALESFGLDVYGIDNGYSGIKEVSSYPKEVSAIFHSKANFVIGDITKRTEFSDNFFDVVSSEAVLEHIFGLEDAFSEMYRILKPGGLIFHSYDPYFHPGGGHALGILDRPWMHLELNAKEYERFLIEKRPFEANKAMHWFKFGINRSYSQSQMTLAILNSGFEILFWESNKINSSLSNKINKHTFKNAILNYKNISIDDLLSQKHSFIARKL